MKHTIQVTRNAHYYHKTAQGPTKGIVVAIHGYGQLASEFIKEFEVLTESGFEVFAPEALSKFYNKKRVAVANWMTSHEREDEIKDYIFFLETLRASIVNQFNNIPIYLVGFSQGVSTLMRWYATGNWNADELHLVAGSVPEELTTSNSQNLKAKCYYYYYGTKDRLIKQQQIDVYLKKMEDIAIKVAYRPFEGRHEVPAELISHFKNLKV